MNEIASDEPVSAGMPMDMTAESAAAPQTAAQRIVGVASPYHVAISPDGTRLFVAEHNGVVAVIDTTTNEVIRLVTLGLP